MERGREEGKQMGRTRRRPLAEDPGFAKVRDLLQAGVLTRAEGARRLHVRYATLAEALDAAAAAVIPDGERRPATPPTTACARGTAG